MSFSCYIRHHWFSYLLHAFFHRREIASIYQLMLTAESSWICSGKTSQNISVFCIQKSTERVEAVTFLLINSDGHIFLRAKVIHSQQYKKKSHTKTECPLCCPYLAIYQSVCSESLVSHKLCNATTAERLKTDKPPSEWERNKNRENESNMHWKHASLYLVENQDYSVIIG